MNLSLLCAANTDNFHCVRHIEVLAAAGVTVHLVDHGYEFTPGVTAAATHRRWPRSGRRTLRRLLGRRLADAVAGRLVRWRLRALWRRRGAEVCHVHWVDDRILSAAEAGLKPLVVTAYGSDINWTRLATYDPELLEQVKAGLARTDLFIADSQDMIDRAEELAGRKLASLLLPIGISTRLFRPGYEEEARAWREALAIPPAAKVVFSPRVLKSNYRHVELVRAFARAVADHGLDGYLVMKTFASDPAYVDEVRAAAAKAGVEARVRILDAAPYERLPVLYAMSDLVVSFPILDAFPVTFLEAAACERPVLTHHCIAYESNGMEAFLNFMDGEDEASIAAQMAGLCADPAAQARARQAREVVAANFDETAFSGALIGAYETVLGRRLRP